MKNLLLVLFIFAGFTTMAQQNFNAEQLNSEWTLLNTDNGVELYIQKIECKVDGVEQPFTYGFLKVVNTTNQEQKVGINIQLIYSDGCVGCNNPNEDYKMVSVAANSTVACDCSFEDNPELGLLIRNPLQTNLQEFENLSLIDFKVY